MTACTIVIINWHSWDLLTDCLKALACQTFQDFKVIVADNSESNQYPPRITDTPLDLTVVLNEANLGFAKGNNQIISQFVDTKWVVCLNPDTLPDTGWLEALVMAADKFPDFSCFGSRLLSYDQPHILDGDGDNYHISGLAWRNAHGFKRSMVATQAPREIFSPCAAAAMYRTETFREIGGFDEDFFCYFEDVDFGFRLRLAGYRALSVSTAIVYHVGSATSGGQDSDFAVYHGQRNLVWTFVKNMPGIALWIFLPLHCGLNLLTLFLFSLRGQPNIIFKAKFDAIRDLPRAFAKRKKIQRHRKCSIVDILKFMNKELLPLRKPSG